jgi:YVTN family beta-propeller protein
VEGTRLRAGIALAVALAFAGVFFVARHGSGNAVADAQIGIDTRSVATGATGAGGAAGATPNAGSTTAPHDPARDFVMTKVATIRGDIAPKSVTATGTGLVFAQNMMYRHTMTVYDAATGALAKTIPDGVDLSAFGVSGHPGVSRGAPVEAAVDASHQHVFATNYSMYGSGFGPEGSDTCRGPRGLSRSFVYRVDLATLAIDGVGEVGMVPKYVAVTPDEKYVLVSNWCSYSLSVLDHDSLREVHHIHLGAYPRGIAVDGAKQVAYVAVMGSFDIARIDLRTFALSYFRGVGKSPRHLVLSNDGRRLFVTLNGDNRVVAVDTADGDVVARTTTGERPRSMAMSSDGRALYVVNYSSNTVSVLRSSDLRVVRTYRVPDHPIGVAYEPTHHRVWVACYSGEILVYDA